MRLGQFVIITRLDDRYASTLDDELLASDVRARRHLLRCLNPLLGLNFITLNLLLYPLFVFTVYFDESLQFLLSLPFGFDVLLFYSDLRFYGLFDFELDVHSRVENIFQLF